MATECVLAIDIGTQTTRAALVRRDGSLIDSARSRLHLWTPRPGWAEQDPEQWWSTTVTNIGTVLGRNPGAAVAALGVGAQMHGVVPLDDAGNVLARRVGLWSDKRAADQVARFVRRPDAPRLSLVAANAPLPAWAGFKIAWYCVEQPELYERTATFLMVKDFLNFRLCGALATDPTEASGTFLTDAATGQWSPELIEALGLRPRILPPIVGSASVVGGILPQVAKVTGLRTGTPVVAGGGDMLCQLLAAGLTRPGRLAEVAGTGSIIAAYGEEPCSLAPVMSLRATTGGWVNFGIGDGVGSCLPWLASLLPGLYGTKRATSSRDYAYSSRDYGSIDDLAVAAPAGAGGLLFFPYLLGERTLGDAGSRASFIGVTLQHDATHLARAVMEGICFDNRRALDLLVPPGDTTVIRCTGGGSHSALWNQIRADIYEHPVCSLTSTEGGVQGAALLAGTGAGWYSDTGGAAEQVVGLNADWQPRPEVAATYRSNYATFRAVHDALNPQWERWCQ